MRKVTIASVVLCVAALAAAPAAVPQRQSLDFRALYHMTLEYQISTFTGAWQVDPDEVRALISGGPVTPDIVLFPMSGGRYHGKMGQDLYDVYQTFVVGPGHTFTVGDVHATYEFAPGKSGAGTFRAVGRIVGGTGRFEGPPAVSSRADLSSPGRIL